MKVEFAVSMGWNNKQTEVIEYDDDITDEELDAEWTTWSANYIDGYWERIDEDTV